MSKRKKTVQYCKNHKEKRSTGTCSRCGSAICFHCQIYYEGKTFCADTCIPEDVRVKNDNQNLLRDTFFYKPLILWSSITLALCSIVFASWILRENELLKNENRALQNNRTVLLSEISSLHDIETEPIYQEDSSSEAPINHEQTPKVHPSITKPVFKPLEPLKQTQFSFSNGSCELKAVSFTFDGGSIANAATEILDTLQSRNVKSTMFLTGHFIKRFPEIVKRIIDQGHEIGNHTLNHPHLTSYSENRIQSTLPSTTFNLLQSELITADHLLFETTGKHFAHLWRAPYGEFNEEICTWARNLGYLHIGWRQGRSWRENFDTNDWIPDRETPGFKTPDEVFTKIVSLANTKPYGVNGGIILLHLGTERKSREDQVHLKLGIMIDSLRSIGYSILPVSEMVARSGVELSFSRNESENDQYINTKD
jgi:peptidoglycan/xylan/chitin deacetylase (PgdA/CDA1 family)